ncbi:hypothetical protein [Heyndrickxia oleronia]|uniref:Uncharacterized protein n=1 Tax=Heyndrickxia oleronia TaxID=38875 RepID=A0A8E2IFV7_9BACI|nr:hypothetical protein [Heyndrickxia oleronia]MEC1372972.1 hypothetical protein [Heyndrickxia oleronia]OOP69181.1 hypothetical protein BWZ43_06550 [Heyndrickxia oleronia]QQZ03824.1 hypothetical protein I5818_19090 [Heyndrickxia oleronia]
MDWKKYAIIVPPAVLLTIILAFSLPLHLKPYTLAIPLISWGVYYTWIYMEKQRKSEDTGGRIK